MTATANVSEAIDSLTLLREDVIATNAALAGDLTALSGVVDTLKADYDSANMAIADMVANVQAGFADVDTAVREALEGLVIIFFVESSYPSQSVLKRAFYKCFFSLERNTRHPVPGGPPEGN